MKRFIGGIVLFGIMAGGFASEAPELKGFLQREQMAHGYPPAGAYPRVVESPRVDTQALGAQTREMLGYLRDFAEVAYLLEEERFDEARAVFEKMPPRSKRPAALILAEGRLETEVASREMFSARRARARKDAARGEALEKAANERLGRAAALAREVIDSDRKNVDAWMALAATLRQSGKQEELLDVYRQARVLAPGHIDLLEKLGARLRMRLNLSRDPKERNDLVAELQSVYEELVEALPGRRSARYQEVLAILKSGSGDRQGAIEHYSKLVQLEPGQFRHYAQLSRHQKESGDEQGALATLRRGMARDANSPELLGALGWLLRGADAKKRELAFMRSLAAEYPGRDTVQQRYARVLIDQEKAGEAVEVLRRSLEHHADSDSTRKLLIQTCLTDALALSKAGKHKEAARRVETAIASGEASDLPLLYDIVVPIYYQAGELERALGLMAKVASEQPDNWESQLRIVGRLYGLWGKDPRFAAYLEGIETGHPEDPEVLYQTALVRWEVLEEPKVAEKRLRHVLDIAPKHAEAHNSLGYLYAEEGRNLDEALELVQKALAIKPHAGHILDSMGWVYYRKGDFDRAVEWLEKATKQSPDSAEIEEHLGRAYYKAGREREALEVLRKAMQTLMERPGGDSSEDFTELRKLVDTLERKQASTTQPGAVKKP